MRSGRQIEEEIRMKAMKRNYGKKTLDKWMMSTVEVTIKYGKRGEKGATGSF